MIRALLLWWLDRKIQAAEWDHQYYLRGVKVAEDRVEEYRRLAGRANARAYVLRIRRTEVDFPINRKGVTQ